MNVKERLVHHSAWMVATSVVVNGAAFLFQAALARLLGPAGFGVFLLAWTVRTVALSVGLLGLNLTAVREFAGPRDAAQAAGIARYLGLCLFSGAASAVVLAVTAPALATAFLGGGEHAVLLYLLAPGVLLGVVTRFLVGVEQAKQNMRQVFLGQAVEAGLQILLLGALAAWQRTAGAPVTAVEAAAVLLAAALVQCGWVVYVFRRHELFRDLSLAGVLPHLRPRAATLGYGLTMSIIALGYVVVASTDRLFLGYFHPSAVAGRYAAAALLVTPLQMLHGALSNAALEPLAGALKGGTAAEVERIYRFVNKLTSLVAVLYCGAVLALGAPLLAALFGRDYLAEDTAALLLLFAVTRFFTAWTGPTSSLLLMGGRVRLELINTLVLIVTNVALGWVLVRPYAGVGVAAATLAAALLNNGLQLVMIRRTSGFWTVDGYQLALLAAFALFAAALWRFPEAGLAALAVLTVAVALFAGYRLEAGERVFLRRLFPWI